ncbi:MAG: hypothetical protein HY462_01755 [Parcubacteria group bacterium]|nr:hypothetical protein [Parcubacteria group bacterium]
MAEKKPPAHKVALAKLAEACADLKDVGPAPDGRMGPIMLQVITTALQIRALAFAEMLSEAHVPKRDHPEVAALLGKCGPQVVTYPVLGNLVEELRAEFAKTKPCPKCGTGLEEDGTCRNPAHSVDPSVQLVTQLV